MKTSLLFLFVLSLFAFSAFAEDKINLSEKDYQSHWCEENNGIMEVVLDDGPRGSRVDCLTETHAIEFDFIHKWPESLAQSQYYAKMTERKPGIVLIIKDKNNPYNYVYIQRLLNTIAEYESGIRFWFVYTDDIKPQGNR